MIEIAHHSPEPGIFQKDIAKNQDISNKYLDHIIHGLKVARLIASVKGKKSGYVLTRPAGQITVFEIHSAFEPGICVIDCLDNAYQCDRKDGCAARGFWGALNQQITAYFKSVTLQDLVEKKTTLEDIETS